MREREIVNYPCPFRYVQWKNQYRIFQLTSKYVCLSINHRQSKTNNQKEVRFITYISENQSENQNSVCLSFPTIQLLFHLKIAILAGNLY